MNNLLAAKRNNDHKGKEKKIEIRERSRRRKEEEEQRTEGARTTDLE
jgi:hypothetical protein